MSIHKYKNNTDLESGQERRAQFLVSPIAALLIANAYMAQVSEVRVVGHRVGALPRAAQENTENNTHRNDVISLVLRAKHLSTTTTVLIFDKSVLISSRYTASYQNKAEHNQQLTTTNQPTPKPRDNNQIDKPWKGRGRPQFRGRILARGRGTRAWSRRRGTTRSRADWSSCEGSPRGDERCYFVSKLCVVCVRHE